MADAEASTGDALPDTAHTEPAIIPNPIQRRDTRSSKAGSEGDPERTDTCRICRSEGSPEEPLFYPCKCSGSIRYVHQECLMEWLSHSNKKHCELCKTAFHFTKLYDANMPQRLPWSVFLKRACWHVVQLCVKLGRGTLVALVWLGVIPWVMRWVWRWFFWIADAAWAREAFMTMMQSAPQEQELKQSETTIVKRMMNAMQQLLPSKQDSSFADDHVAYSFTTTLVDSFGFGNGNATSSAIFAWPQADPSILSSWSYVSSLTSSPRANRIILDVFEGQLITCVVITGFVLVFLIREWVVQQQPLVNLENMGIAQQQLREAADRVEAEGERYRRQQELIEQARRRVIELESEIHGPQPGEEKIQNVYMSLERLENCIDNVGEQLDERDRIPFLMSAKEAARQNKVSDTTVDVVGFLEGIRAAFASFPLQDRSLRETLLVDELSKAAQGIEKTKRSRPTLGQPSGHGTEQEDDSSSSQRRPPMPAREFSSRAANIKRLLEEADAVFNGAHGGNREGVSGQDVNGHVPEQSSTDSSSPEIEDNVTSSRKRPDPIPITNAGPDAKINIKRSESSRTKAAPALKIEEEMLENDEAKKKLEDEVVKELEEEMKRTAPAATNGSPTQSHEQQEVSQTNPFHPDGPEPERRNSDTFSNRVASVFREEFGLDEVNEAAIAANGENAADDMHSADTPARQPVDQRPTYFQRVTDWFWGDIRPQHAEELVPAPNEERQQLHGGEDDGQEAPFVPILDRRPNPARAPPAQPQQPHHDPEVVAAAQQAGLDPEALEDAEDLEGLLELIGLQGPLIGLFQTSAFCTLLVACTIVCAVVLPYLGGKLVLNLLASPVYLLIKLPLRIATLIADPLIDIALMVGSCAVMVVALAVDFLLSAAEAWLPSLSRFTLAQKAMLFATDIMSSAASRLSGLFASTGPIENQTIEVLAVSWALLASSVHAHASLKTIQEEVNSVLSCMSMAVTWAVETVSTGSVSEVCKKLFLTLTDVSSIRVGLQSVLDTKVTPLLQLARERIASLESLKRGALTVSAPKLTLDPTLVYWNSTDRAFAILTGYAALAALATIYVAADTPITRSESGKKTEKVIRDTLRQAGGVVKVILIISIEMLVFPLYCGMLLDIAFLPLFQNATVASRWAFAGRLPYTFCFVHWFVGTCYMFHFALFVSMCRKILRKGVLWFIRDPDDPTFHPVRDVLERNVATQLRKIAFSALVYGALVILCLGGVIWTIGQVFEGIFPIYWISTEPLLEFPLDLFLYTSLTPLIIRLSRPSDAVNAMYGWWLKRCARVLRLSHFLFDDRRKDEEGHRVGSFWTTFLPSRVGESEDLADNYTDESFKRDGKYVLTPCNDQYRPPKPGEAFLHVDEHDVYIADADGKRNEHFAKVYVPPWFRIRITLFMVCLWMFSALTGLCVTLVPLVFGRYLFAAFMPPGLRVNDIYAYSLGAFALGIMLSAALRGREGAMYLVRRAQVDLRACIGPAQRFLTRLLKCIYVYGFAGIVLPCMFALLLQFYFIMPLHTAFTSTSASTEGANQNSTTTNPIVNLVGDVGWSPQIHLHSLPEHSIHIFQDYALGLLYVRIASRLVISSASRAAEACRRITANGYLNPNIKLATRFFVLPATLMVAVMLLLPPLVTSIALQATRTFAPSIELSEDFVTKAYRYSYPLASTFGILALTVAELGKATSRWRARIRDEVYLVGERLHNFGEKKPPVGSKSVVRKER